MSTDDLPMISPPSDDSTQVDLTPQKEAPVKAQEPPRNPTTQVPKPAVAAPAKPAAPAAKNDASASRPSAPAVKAPIPAAGGDEEDPEKLLREYAERQKTKVVRLEQQVAEYKKVVAERDSLKGKVETLGKELLDAKRQLEAAAKSDEVIKDLQGKIDAAILSNGILTDDKEKLKKGLSQQTENFKKAEERAVQAEKSLAEVQNKLVAETQGREEAESKVAAALAALQAEAAPVKPTPKAVSEAVTRPMKQADEKPATAPPKDEKSATATEAKPVPAAGAKPAQNPPQQRPPGRFSFLKK